MKRYFSVFRAGVVILGLLGVAACSSSDRGMGPAALNHHAIPGTESDFVVNVGDRVFFATDVASLSDEAREVLHHQAEWLKRYPRIAVQINGHADERGTREYNLALSAKRATTVRDFLIAQGVAPTRLSTIAYGKERPVALCDAERCWAQNRRAVTMIVSSYKAYE